MATQRKTFLLGVGCQKGGTTWLYEHLRRSREFAHGYRKEYHVLDSVYLRSEEWMRHRVLDLAEQSLASARRHEETDGRVLHRASMCLDLDLYFDYFAGLLRRAPRIRAAGDVTPSYGLLPPSALRTVRDEFSRRGVRTACVFLMRDPVERTWSQIRMQMDREPQQFSQASDVVLLDRYADDVYALRSEYHHTLAALDEVFEPDAVHVGFYENLFTAKSVRAITDLLGMKHVEPDAATRRNSSSRDAATLPEETARTVALHHADVYRAVAHRFPQVDLLSLWPHSQHVLG